VIARINLTSVGIFCLALCLTACGGSVSGEASDSQTPAPSANGEPAAAGESANINAGNTWALGDYRYIAFNSDQLSTDWSVTILAGGSDIEDNGVYTGANLALRMTPTGPGVYSITDFDSVVAAHDNGGSPALAVLLITGQDNDPAQNSTWRSLATAGTATVTVGSQNQYVVTINDPVILERTGSNGPLQPGSDQLEFTADRIRGLSVNYVPVE